MSTTTTNNNNEGFEEYEPTINNILAMDTLKWIFVGGKGGVGKTTTSCSIAIQLAKVKESVLLISTDPAHNLSDAFGQKFTKHPSLVTGFSNLFCMEIDPTPDQDAPEFMDKKGSNPFGFNMAEIAQSIPGIDEAMSFAEVMKLVQNMQFSVIVFDTAPTGHTLRLLSIPSLLDKGVNKFMEGNFSNILNTFSGVMGSEAASPEAVQSKIMELKKTIEEVNVQFKNPDYFNQDVTNILSRLMVMLNSDPTKRFVWSETSFLQKWWTSPNVLESERAIMRALVARKQLEFVGGGWVQQDEASPDVPSIIQQMTEGLRFLWENFRVHPETAWQIDPFGHSGASGSLFPMMGFRNEVKIRMKATADLQFVWRGNPNIGWKSDIFAHVLDEHYSFPVEFDRNSFYYNSVPAARRFNDFIVSCRKKQIYYGGLPHILVPMGNDFAYTAPWLEFEIMDNFIKMAANRTDIVVRYSTAKEYFSMVEKWADQNNYKYHYYVGDFFPYNRREDWWTGYYTTRPVLKGMQRSSAKSWRVASFLASNNPSSNSQGLFDQLQDANRNISVMLHHDALTGTAKARVVADYFSRMKDANEKVDTVSTVSLKTIFGSSDNMRSYKQDEILVFGNATVKQMILVNSLAWPLREIQSVFIRYEGGDESEVNLPICPFSVWTSRNSTLGFDCFFISPQFPPIIRLDFLANIPAMGSSSFFIRKAPPARSNPGYRTKYPILDPGPSEITNFVNSELSLSFGDNYLLRSIQRIATRESIQVNQTVHRYRDMGGAYVFAPWGEAVDDTIRSQSVQYYNGRFKKELQVNFSPDLKVIISLVSTGDREIDDKVGVEYRLSVLSDVMKVSRFSTNLESTHVFSDNGLLFLKRPENKFYTSLAQSYYPSAGVSIIGDAKSTFGCIMDKPHGVSSLSGQGLLEMGLHRNLLSDDGKGMAEANNDRSMTTTKSRCLISRSPTDEGALRRAALQFQHSLQPFIIDDVADSPSVPKTIHILDIETYQGRKMIRVMNLDAKTDFSLDLRNIFNDPIVAIQETDITGLLPYSEMLKRYPPQTSDFQPIINGSLLYAYLIDNAL
eukprot:gene16302-19389_t